MKMRLIASLLAAIIMVSGVLGSFYFAGAQVSAAQTLKPLLIVSPSSRAVAGESLSINGSNFLPSSQVSISLVSIVSNASMQTGKAYLIQAPTVNSTESTNALVPPAIASSNGNFFGKALSTLSNLFGAGPGNSNSNKVPLNNSTVVANLAQPLMLIFQNQSRVDRISLNCQNTTILVASVGPASTTVAAVPSSAQLATGCTLTATKVGSALPDISSALNVTNSQANLKLPSESVQTSSIGSLHSKIQLPSTALGQYGVLAQGNSPNYTAFTSVNVRSASSSIPSTISPQTQPALNQSTVSNQSVTASINNTSISNSTQHSTGAGSNSATTSAQSTTAEPSSVIPATPVNNSASSTGTTSSNQNSTGSAAVQISENQVRPGAPVAISGSGFKPQVPVQVFINNVQITNIITNIHGSFDSVVIVPTSVNSGTANVVVKSQQTNISNQITVVKSPASAVHTTVKFNALVAGSGAQPLNDVPVSIINTHNGQIVSKGKTPLELQDLAVGTYYVFYSDLSNYVFASAAPGKWSDTNNGGAGVITVSGVKDITVTALYEPRPTPPTAPQPIRSSMSFHSVDTSGNPIPGMFVTLYNPDASQIIQQGYTDLKVSNLLPGTYPVFFANFGSAVFASGSPGTWIQTPYGGAGLVTIADDGATHNINVTATYQVVQTTIASEPTIHSPLDLSGSIYTITANTTQPSGPYILSGSFHLKVTSDQPANASLSAYMVSVNDDANPNVTLNSESTRDYHTIQIVHLHPIKAGPVGTQNYAISGTADVLVDGTLYSTSENTQILVSGGQDLTPTNVQISFLGTGQNDAAARLGTIYGSIDLGIK